MSKKEDDTKNVIVEQQTKLPACMPMMMITASAGQERNR